MEWRLGARWLWWCKHAEWHEMGFSGLGKRWMTGLTDDEVQESQAGRAARLGMGRLSSQKTLGEC